jgi:beta-fructofuranosidase
MKQGPSAIIQEQIESARRVRLHLLADPYRPAYHFVVPEDFARPADPNGALFWNGRYHLHYIYQERGVHYWGHVSSLDLLHWRHHPPSLFPTPDSPEEGIFSGNCFVNKDGEATILYHGFKVGNSIATSSDPHLDGWRKLPSNPIIPVEEGKWRESGTLPYTSWDPHGWLQGDRYYAIFGGTRPALFTATKLDEWSYVGDFFGQEVEGVSPREDVSCPDFFPLGDKWVLLCISHELGCRYYVGDWRDEQFFPELHERMSYSDNTFFAPESLLDPSGRRILWAWIFDQQPDDVKAASGWSGTFSLPRELWLGEDNHLRMRPVEELKQLRYNERRWQNLRLAPESEFTLADVHGSLLDLEMEIQIHGAEQYGVKVFCSADGDEETVIGYDRSAGTLFIDTRRSSQAGMGNLGVEAGPLSLADAETLHLRVLVDRSVVEVFANDRQALLRRVYPGEESIHVKLFTNGGAAHVLSLSCWEMMPSNPF